MNPDDAFDIALVKIEELSKRLDEVLVGNPSHIILSAVYSTLLNMIADVSEDEREIRLRFKDLLEIWEQHLDRYLELYRFAKEKGKDE